MKNYQPLIWNNYFKSVLSTNVGKYNLWKLFPMKFGTVCFYLWIFTTPLLASMALSLADSASDICVEIWLLEVISLCASFSCCSFFCRFVHSWVICSCNCDSRSKLSFSPEIKKIFQCGKRLSNRIIQKCEILWYIYNAKTNVLQNRTFDYQNRSCMRNFR